MDTSAPEQPAEKPVSSPGKGKGKATQDSNAMEEDEEEEEDEEDGEEAEDVEEDDDEDDDMVSKTFYSPPVLESIVLFYPRARLDATFLSGLADGPPARPHNPLHPLQS